MKPLTVLTLISLGLLVSCASQSTPGAAASAPAETPPALSSAQDKMLSLQSPFGQIGPVAGLSDGERQNFGPNPRNARLGAASIPSSGQLSAQALTWNQNTAQVQLRVLVLYAGSNDFGLPTARALLQQNGVPFTEIDTTTTPLTQATLANSAGVGLYSGVMLTSNALTTESGGLYISALNDDEWATLFSYEKAYKVRQLALFGYPQNAPEDYGLRAVPGTETASTTATVTAGGRAVFSDLTQNGLPVQNAYAYPSQTVSVSGVSTTPLLTDPQGNVLAATSTSADGRERLLLTMAQNPYLLHTQLFGYGLVQWLTRGVHLGEYQRFLHIDADDWFNASDVFDPATKTVTFGGYRLSSSDVLSMRDQQLAIRSDFPLAPNFHVAQAFNAETAVTNVASSCATTASFSAITKCVASSFDWVNHTYTHDLMDVMNTSTAYWEINKNIQAANQLGLPLSRRSLVTPEHSGLGWKSPGADETLAKVDYGLAAGNASMLSAAQLTGMRYVASNHSVLSQWDPTCPSCGVYNPLNSSILLVPRWPNNIGYDTTTPDQATARYNAVYGPAGTAPYWDHDLSYSEFLSKEAQMGLVHILNGTAWPTYMHVGNQRQYAPGHSLLGDWVRAVLGEYSKYSTLPLNSLKWDDIGAYVKDRTDYEHGKANITAVWNRANNTLKLTNSGLATQPVYVTGRSSTAGNTQTYGGRNVTLVNVTALGAQLSVTPQ